jgi:valacyclovir hydrolase
MPWFEHGNNRIYYEEEGSKDPLLLIPGWSLSIEDLQPIRQVLTPRYRVIAADPPGSGRSGPQPREYTASYYQDDSRLLLALLDELRATPAHLVGFSDGGEYALLMAELKPASVRSVVAWGAMGKVEASTGIVEEFVKMVDNPSPPLQEFSDYLKTAYGEDNARTMVRTAAKAWEAIMNAGGDISRKRAGDITCPVLLIAGERDFMNPPPLVSEMAGAVQHGEFIAAPGASHAVHHESPDWLARTIVDWLSKH